MSEMVCVEGSMKSIKQGIEEEQHAKALKMEYLTKKYGSKLAAEEFLSRSSKKR